MISAPKMWEIRKVKKRAYTSLGTLNQEVSAIILFQMPEIPKYLYPPMKKAWKIYFREKLLSPSET